MRAAVFLSCLVLGTSLSATPGWAARRRHGTKVPRAEPVAAVPFELPADMGQLLLVTTPSWRSVQGQLRRFERGEDGALREVGTAVPVQVGRHGMGWGVGFGKGQPGPEKIEGDGRAPAGLFALGSAFGRAKAADAALKLPYLELTPETECVDDARSASYNRVLPRSSVAAPDWKSSERMLALGEVYRWGAVVQYNQPPIPGRGSCIFLHVSTKRGGGTAGCTAMRQEALVELLRWLDAGKQPHLLQLPERIFTRHAPHWRLAAAPASRPGRGRARP